MGITKLMHIKERSKGRMNQGMINAIYYITNPEKTDNTNTSVFEKTKVEI